MKSPHRLFALALVALSTLAAASCSSSSKTENSTTSTTVARAEFTGKVPDEITAPPAKGGINLPQPAAPLPKGYVMEELFVGGSATKFKAADTPENGMWNAAPDGEAKYRTRVIVRRPAKAADFNGTVLVEWFNVSVLEASPDWALMGEEIGREGGAYVGVSTQAQGVEGGNTLIDLEVDPAQEKAFGTSGNTDKSGLKKINPARYGTLAHPGDAYSYDMYSQVGRAARTQADKLLGGLQPKKVIAVGESQSAAFLTTLVNAVHPLDPTFDGFLIHSRGANGAPLDGKLSRSGNESDQDGSGIGDRAIHIRTDLDVPVFIFVTETDLTLLRYAQAVQPDTDMVRTWQVAGTSHADAHFIRSIIGGPRDPGVGSILKCKDPINVGPQHEVLQAALNHFVTWVTDGTAPPTGIPIELEKGKETVIKRASDGIALGGVRNPLVDVPIAATTGDPGGDVTRQAVETGNICGLFGSTTSFDRAALLKRYGSADNYVKEFRASAVRAVAAGFLLQPDADNLIAEAETNRKLFG